MHAAVLSWDRQPFLTTTLTGKPSPFMKYRELSSNFLINNYHMEMAIDTDDGTSYMRAHHNFLVGGEWALKSDQGGHSNWQWENLCVQQRSQHLSLLLSLATFASANDLLLQERLCDWTSRESVHSTVSRF